MDGLWGLQGVMVEDWRFHIYWPISCQKILTTDFYIEYNRDLTNLGLTGRGWEEVVICADGCCINSLHLKELCLGY